MSKTKEKVNHPMAGLLSLSSSTYILLFVSFVTGFGESPFRPRSASAIACSLKERPEDFYTRLLAPAIDATALPNRSPETELGRFKDLRDSPVVWDNDF